MKITLDYPPIWLIGFIATTWATKDAFPLGEGILGLRVLGWGLFVVGLALAFAALWVMRRAKTTFIPHENPENLVITGPFRYSRNPIYLADAFTLAGFSLGCGTWIGLILTPFFMAVIQKRFIIQEEKKLEATFGEAFLSWARTTRRWL